jgi:predicted nucleic acid-binding Zn ribbon protein
MKEDPIATCPECAGSVKRLLYPVGIVFKGSGWHINDYRKPEKGGNSEEGSAKTEAKSSDTNPKTETASEAVSSSESTK